MKYFEYTSEKGELLVLNDEEANNRITKGELLTIKSLNPVLTMTINNLHKLKDIVICEYCQKSKKIPKNLFLHKLIIILIIDLIIAISLGWEVLLFMLVLEIILFLIFSNKSFTKDPL